MTATGDKLVIDGKNYYATGTTVTVSSFTSGAISFDYSITSLAKSGDNIVAKGGEEVALTISGLTYPTSINSWKVEGTGANYGKRYTGGAVISGSKIAYQTPADEIFVTVTGLKSGVTLSDTNIAVKNNKVTIKDAGLLTNGASISVDNNYTVELANTLNPVKTAASWGKISSGKAKYTYASTTEGYSLTDNKISYTAAVAAKSFTVSGIKSTSGIKVDGTTVTLGAANLNKKAVTISDGYTIKLGSDVTAAVESTATLKNGKYTTAGVKTTGYKLANNKISYLTKNLKTITFSGLTSGAKTSDITISGKKITLGKNAIPTNGTAVSVKTSGYTLATDNLSEVIISDKGTAKKANYYFATSGTLPNGYIKTTGSDKKTYYVQDGAKFNQAYAEYGIKARVVEGTTTTYMAAAPSGYTKVIDANGTFYTNAITMNAKLTNAAVSGKNLVLTDGKESLTVSGAAKKTVEVTAKGILYKAAAGLLTR